jgi:hypothetical protein
VALSHGRGSFERAASGEVGRAGWGWICGGKKMEEEKRNKIETPVRWAFQWNIWLYGFSL